MRELTSANCEMADEYFFAKLFFWVIPVCTEASAEASTVAWKKTVKKKNQRSNPYMLNNLITAQKLNYLAESSPA